MLQTKIMTILTLDYSMNLSPRLLEELQLKIPSPIQEWRNPVFEKNQIRVFVSEDNLIHPWIQGNKWYKLKPWLEKFFAGKNQGLATMGGAFSNHLIALGYAAWKLNIPATAFIRGGEDEWKNNPVIHQLRNWKMNLIPTSRADFRHWHQEISGPELSAFGLNKYLWIPLGGSHSIVLESVAQWAQELEGRIPGLTHVALPIASGGTLAGFAQGLRTGIQLLAIPVVKGSPYPESLVFNLISERMRSIVFQNDYHFGGFARSSQPLKDFCRQLFEKNGFQIEPVYSGKAFFAVSDLAEKGYFTPGSRILVVHTGGVFPWNLD